MSGGVSIHAVDVVTGRPAIGMKVELRRLSPGPALIAAGEIGADGTLPGPHASGAGVVAGAYEVLFDFGGFYGAGSSAPFLTLVPFRFHVRQDDEHVHLPLKFSPWGLALFRGL